MFIADVQYDIYIQLSNTDPNQADDTEKSTRERFFQTLSNFTDPFSRNDEPTIDNFSYNVTGWINNTPRVIIGENREFDLRNLEDLEHIIEGKLILMDILRDGLRFLESGLKNILLNQSKSIKHEKIVPLVLFIYGLELLNESITVLH